MIYMGIDPGLEGAIAVISDSSASVTMSLPVIKDKKDRYISVVELIDILYIFKPDVIVLEEVHAMPKQGVSSTFKFGKVYGQILASIQHYCSISETVYVLVSPQRWLKNLGDSYKQEGKATSVAWAEAVYPKVSIKTGRAKKGDHNRADALGLAYYGLTRIKTKKDLNNN